MKENKEKKERYSYHPSKLFLLSMIYIIFALSLAKSPLAYGFGQALLFLVFAYDLETRKEKIEKIK